MVKDHERIDLFDEVGEDQKSSPAGVDLMNVTISGGGFSPMPTVQATMRSRVNLSFQHMQEAIHLMELSKDCEAANSGKTFADGDFSNHHRAYVVGAIMTSVASVEARINEFYLDATDNLLGSILDTGSQALLAELWKVVDEKRFPILQKYQIALAAIERSKFDTSTRPYQDVDLLIDLRNMLVHFKPEWDNDQKKHRQIEEKLKGRFELNPFWPKDGPIFFPFKCLSHGCASWAVRSSMNFILKFFALIGLDPETDLFKKWKAMEESL